MDKSPIVVRRWRVYVRRFTDGLAKPFSTLLWRIRSIAVPKRSRVKILIKTPGKERATSPAPGILRIKHRPVDAESTSPITPAPSPVNSFLRRRKRAAANSISVTGGLELCKACGDLIANGDELAHCDINLGHTIHRNDIPMMKNKCPQCGGHVT